MRSVAKYNTKKKQCPLAQIDKRIFRERPEFTVGAVKRSYLRTGGGMRGRISMWVCVCVCRSVMRSRELWKLAGNYENVSSERRRAGARSDGETAVPKYRHIPVSSAVVDNSAAQIDFWLEAPKNGSGTGKWE